MVDRCNFDFEQRHHWFKIAEKYGVTRIDSLFLDVGDKLCKERIVVRKDHPTIPEGEAGIDIIEKFGKGLIPPVKGEGFTDMLRITTEEESNTIINQIINN